MNAVNRVKGLDAARNGLRDSSEPEAVRSRVLLSRQEARHRSAAPTGLWTGFFLPTRTLLPSTDDWQGDSDDWQGDLGAEPLWFSESSAYLQSRHTSVVRMCGRRGSTAKELRDRRSQATRRDRIGS